MTMCRYIAEVGVNHMGSADLARLYVERLVKTEVSAITFQIREDSFYDGSIGWKNPLSIEVHQVLRKLTRDGNRAFGMSVADVATARRASVMAPDFWKVLSISAHDYALLEFIVSTGSPVYVSTGLSSDDDIMELVRRFPTVRLIHTQLSSAIEHANLKRIQTLRGQTRVPVAYGLHSSDWRILFMALCFQPEALFFYVKDDEPRAYADDSHAIALKALPALIDDLGSLETAIGTGVKHLPAP